MEYMRYHEKKEKSKKKKSVCKLCLFLFAMLFLTGVSGNGENVKARTGVAEEIRVGLKSKYAFKRSITLYNTELELGYCDGQTYLVQLHLSAEDGVEVTPEKGAFFVADGSYSAAEAERTAKEITEAGAVAYAVLFSAGEAGVYLPVEENGGTEAKARTICEKAAFACDISLENGAKESAYLIRITAGERILFADGEQGTYPQFAATEENEEGIFAVDMGERSYRGRMEIGRYGGRTTVTAVNVVPLEEYLYGVVPCEMPASWHTEALKAQAVCSRSFALMKAGYRAETELKRGFRMEDTEQSQVYGGITYEHERSTAAVDATAGQTLCYENRTVAGYYFAASGGQTENVEDVWNFALPYLKGVSDVYETNPSKKPWSVTLNTDELADLLAAVGEEIGEVQRVTQQITTSSGRVYSLRVTGSLGSVTLDTSALRNILQLASTKFKVFGHNTVPDAVTVQGASGTEETTIHDCFLLDGNGKVQSADGLTEQYVVLSADNMSNFPAEPPEEGAYLFAGMGSGHGVGMSQSGARGMAECGFTYSEILEHYFTGISVR